MVIELSGVQFGLKPSDLKSQVCSQTKIILQLEVQLPLCYIHFEIAQFKSLRTRTTRFFIGCEKDAI